MLHVLAWYGPIEENFNVTLEQRASIERFVDDRFSTGTFDRFYQDNVDQFGSVAEATESAWCRNAFEEDGQQHAHPFQRHELPVLNVLQFDFGSIGQFNQLRLAVLLRRLVVTGRRLVVVRFLLLRVRLFVVGVRGRVRRQLVLCLEELVARQADVRPVWKAKGKLNLLEHKKKIQLTGLFCECSACVS